MQYSKVEICGVNTSKLRVLKEEEKVADDNEGGHAQRKGKGKGRND